MVRETWPTYKRKESNENFHSNNKDDWTSVKTRQQNNQTHNTREKEPREKLYHKSSQQKLYVIWLLQILNYID